MRSLALLSLFVVLISAAPLRDCLSCSGQQDCQEDAAKVQSCMVAAAAAAAPLEPLNTRPMKYWPGMQTCVSCRFAAGVAVGVAEIALLWVIGKMFFLKQKPSFELPEKRARAEPAEIPAWAIAASAAGWFYYLATLAINWNFISYLMLAGFAMVAPAIISALWLPKGAERTEALKRRAVLAGWLLGAVTLVMFPDVSTLPSQFQRRLNPSLEVLTPAEPLILQLRSELFSEISPTLFATLGFQAQMLYVDEFIYRKVSWKSDYQQYLMVGLLTTPQEVLTRGAGDCQGQAVVTASLLLSMGVRAWVVETPFHWWTHAEDPVTGGYFDLNFHGSAGSQGSVNPQPIAQVYTHPPAACTNCWSVEANNNPGSLYAAPPHLAFAVAWTGAHIFVRSNFTVVDGDYVQFAAFSAAIAVAEAAFASFLHADYDPSRVVNRIIAAMALGGGPAIFGAALWATVYYPVSLLHILAVVVFSQAFIQAMPHKD